MTSPNFSMKNGLPPYANQSGQNSVMNTSTNDANFMKNSHTLSVKSLQTSMNENFKVVVRVRPPLSREITDGRFISTMQVSPDNRKICIYEYYNIELVEPDALQEYVENPNNYTMHQFSFDYVYDQDNTQEDIYENTAKSAVISTLQGFNATMMAYGQTGTGKTFTMEGFKYNNIDPQRGIIPRAIEEIFKFIENCSDSKTTFMVRASYLQIYNENISDLLRTDRTSLHIREDKKKGVFVEGLSEWAVRTPSEIYSLIKKGALSRATASTKMNDVSSRSHAVFVIIVEQMSIDENDLRPDAPKQIKVGKLNLVDLAGSERVRVTGATGKRLEECKKINQSLSALGNVISALTDSKQPKSHIPYRDSKLTRILEDSLGGNCKTTFMAMVSPAIDAFGESLSTLKFANRAKNIKNAPIVNEDVDQRTLLRKYEIELKKLRSELDERNKHLIDKSRLFQLEEEKKKAELDKNQALHALEARSREFFEEREEKKKLEEKIKSMYSQVLVGGRKIEDTPQFRNALEEHQRVIRQQYEQKLQEFEKERLQIEEDKAQVDRYKQLLLKQRDIMIALTTRLNERDETIIQLQEELDAYDRIHRETEEMLDQKSLRVQVLEKALRDNHLPVPKETLAEQTTKKKATEEPVPKRPFKESNPDVVNYDGKETYNITQNNLTEEKLSDLRSLAENQKNEIKRLSFELEKYKRREQIDVMSGYENKHSMDRELAGRLEEFQIKYERERQAQEELVEVVREKENEIKQLQNFIENQEANGGSNISSINQEIKASIDAIIETLSMPNDPQKLQNVAKELLYLQKVVNGQIAPHGEQRSEAFLNISHIVNTSNQWNKNPMDKRYSGSYARNENSASKSESHLSNSQIYDQNDSYYNQDPKLAQQYLRNQNANLPPKSGNMMAGNSQNKPSRPNSNGGIAMPVKNGSVSVEELIKMKKQDDPYRFKK